jgi:uncharacterized membrane protein YtjA (UPF0391 family)
MPRRPTTARPVGFSIGSKGVSTVGHAAQAVAGNHLQGVPMLHYAVVFFVIALIAAVFGFGGLAAGAAGIAKVLFFVFVIMAVATFLFGLIRKS